MNYKLIINSLADELADTPEYEAFFEVIKQMSFTEPYAEKVVFKLDQVYKIIIIRLLTQRKEVNELEIYCQHLSKVTHKSREAHINSMSKPFFTQWLTYCELVEDYMDSYDPIHLEKVMNMKNVKEILMLILERENIKQQEILETLDIGKKANLSRILKIMERNFLISKQKINGQQTISPGSHAPKNNDVMFADNNNEEPLNQKGSLENYISTEKTFEIMSGNINKGVALT